MTNTSNGSYVAPIAAGYVALYRHEGRLRDYPVVALAVQGTRADALVLNDAGQAVPAVMGELPGTFAGVYPTDHAPRQ